MIPPFELRFSKSSSCYYADAVRLAAALPNYEELRDGHRREHICRPAYRADSESPHG
jgi:hypothetical protein